MMNYIHGSDADNSLDDGRARIYTTQQYQTTGWF
jgi:hypothetical protein